ncbi:MAG: adenylyltransferase/cytidyltransferase family protein [Burkholderiaceae bacterium]|jgi:rfaE bifunctional protein nucleotidyltransferase chain/domain|nr:adenylyltransferase/cytidyltransferase family protein [Burkholderiaceae bacterium]
MTFFTKKICGRDELAKRVAALPRLVVATNGVFDILHRGHVTYLARARALGASLVVAVNTDDSVRRLGKGDDRPVNPCDDRMAVLAALASVDLVVPFDEDTALNVVRIIVPDVYTKGGDYNAASTPEGMDVLSGGRHVVSIPFEHDRSTTAILERIRHARLKQAC